MATITFTIDNAKVVDFKAGFLKEHPVPLDSTDTPLYKDLVWIEMVIRKYAIGEYKHGKKRLAFEAAVADDSIIT